jgi:hypothetical protein
MKLISFLIIVLKKIQRKILTDIYIYTISVFFCIHPVQVINFV